MTGLTRYRRSRSGEVVHRSDCRFIGRGVPWRWADEHLRTDQDLVLWLFTRGPLLGVRACKRCLSDVAHETGVQS
jgi:hypothetical protein